MSGASRRVLVTGASGFVGRHVLTALARAGQAALLGLGRNAGTRVPDGAEFRAVDLADRAGLASCLRSFRPSHVLHLAAQASVGQAHGAGVETWRTNVAGLLNLAEDLLAEAPESTLIFVSSSEVYGRAFLSGEPVSEGTVPKPVGVYARTKCVGEKMLADVLSGSHIRLIILRPFNHTGPGQDERFVVPAFAHQIARIEVGLIPPRLAVGNLDSFREFLDVRDVARAYAMIVEASERLESGLILNIAAGQSRRIGSVLDDLMRLAKVPFEIVIDPSRARASEIRFAAGDNSRIRDAIGWMPQIPWSDTLTDALEDARAKVAAEI
ncbi:NAD-dependent epimerase/dehydratase family protein [Methylobacterium sp. NFXW15]|uniref:NAD-dependent epimerase/dehydratase family protein n=1 Tax=Methylobacterium sp. NFXW15 TaxID=2819512 RepID=UPI003CE716B3